MVTRQIRIDPEVWAELQRLAREYGMEFAKPNDVLRRVLGLAPRETGGNGSPANLEHNDMKPDVTEAEIARGLRILTKAERELGPLTLGQTTDLFADNTTWSIGKCGDVARAVFNNIGRPW